MTAFSLDERGHTPDGRLMWGATTIALCSGGMGVGALLLMGVEAFAADPRVAALFPWAVAMIKAGYHVWDWPLIVLAGNYLAYVILLFVAAHFVRLRFALIALLLIHGAAVASVLLV